MEIRKISPDKAGERLDLYLSRELERSRSFVQKLCEDGHVLSGSSALKKNYVLRGGEDLAIDIPDVRPSLAEAEEIPLNIVFEDSELIVINKPRGMVVHPAAGHYEGTLVNALLAHCGDSLSGIGGELRPGIVHRIDKDTSGLIIAAKNDRAHISLSSQLATRSLSRTYDAVVYGKITESGKVDAPIARSPKDRKKMAIVSGGRHAVTHFFPVSVCNGFSHIRCKLETGRTHQIRVHMASIGHAVAGDAAYGPKKDKTGLGGQCLHASELMFIHPVSGEEIVLSCPLPDYFSDFLRKNGLE